MVECSGEPFYYYVVCVTKNKRIILITYAMLKCFVAGKWGGGRRGGSSLAIFFLRRKKNKTMSLNKCGKKKKTALTKAFYTFCITDRTDLPTALTIRAVRTIQVLATTVEAEVASEAPI